MLLSSPSLRAGGSCDAHHQQRPQTNLISCSILDPTVRRCMYPVSIAFLPGVSFYNTSHEGLLARLGVEAEAVAAARRRADPHPTADMPPSMLSASGGAALPSFALRSGGHSLGASVTQPELETPTMLAAEGGGEPEDLATRRIRMGRGGISPQSSAHNSSGAPTPAQGAATFPSSSSGHHASASAVVASQHLRHQQHHDHRPTRDGRDQQRARRNATPPPPQDQSVPFVHPAVYALLAHHCYGTLRHLAVRALGDTVIPLALSHAGTTLCVLDARNCDKSAFSEAIAGQALLLQGNPKVLRIVDVCNSTFDRYATPSDWEMSEAPELRPAAKISHASSYSYSPSPSSPAEQHQEEERFGGNGRLLRPLPPRVYQPVAPATPLTNFKWFLDNLTGDADEERRRRGVIRRSVQQQKQQRPTVGGGRLPTPPLSSSDDSDYTSGDDLERDAPPVPFDPFADKNVRRATARHNQNANPPSAPFQSPTAACRTRVLSSNFVAQLLAKFEYVVYGSEQMWRSEVSGKLWRLVASEQRLKQQFSAGGGGGVAGARAPQSASVGQGNAEEPPLLGTAFMRDFNTVCSPTERNHIGGLSNSNNNVDAVAAASAIVSRGFASCGRVFSFFDCLAMQCAVSPVDAARQALFGMDQAVWRLLLTYMRPAGGQEGAASAEEGHESKAASAGTQGRESKVMEEDEELEIVLSTGLSLREICGSPPPNADLWASGAAAFAHSNSAAPTASSSAPPLPPLALSARDVSSFFAFYVYSLSAMCLKRNAAASAAVDAAIKGTACPPPPPTSRSLGPSAFAAEWADSLYSLLRINEMSAEAEKADKQRQQQQKKGSTDSSGSAWIPRTEHSRVDGQERGITASVSAIARRAGRDVAATSLAHSPAFFAHQEQKARCQNCSCGGAGGPRGGRVAPPVLPLSQFTPLSILCPLIGGPATAGAFGVTGVDGADVWGEEFVKITVGMTKP